MHAVDPNPPDPAAAARPRVLLVTPTTGYQAEAVRLAAERLGVSLLLATDRCHVLEDPWGDRALPIRFEAPEEAVERIVSLAAAAPLQAVMALGDRASVIAAAVNTRLGLAGHPPAAAAACRNKFLAHQAWAQAGLPVPRFARFAAASDPGEVAADVAFPCVLKPLTVSGGGGFIRATTRQSSRRRSGASENPCASPAYGSVRTRRAT